MYTRLRPLLFTKIGNENSIPTFPQSKSMQIVAYISTFLGGLLIFLAIKQSFSRLVAGISSLLLATLIYGVANSLAFIDSLGFMGLLLWFALNATVLISFVYELKVKTNIHRLTSMICLGAVTFLNVIFALFFIRIAGLGVV